MSSWQSAGMHLMGRGWKKAIVILTHWGYRARRRRPGAAGQAGKDRQRGRWPPSVIAQFVNPIKLAPCQKQGLTAPWYCGLSPQAGNHAASAGATSMAICATGGWHASHALEPSLSRTSADAGLFAVSPACWQGAPS